MKLAFRTVSAATVVFLALSTHGHAQMTEPVARPALVYTVEETTSQLRFTYPAIVLPSQEVELSFRVSGQIIELPIRGALQVNEGDVLARLDPRDFETQISQLETQRDQADAQLRALRAGGRPEEIAQLEAAVRAAQAQFQQAREQVARTRQLVESNVASPVQLDQDLAALNVAQAELDAQEQQLAIGQSGGRPEELDSAEAALRGIEVQLENARSALDDATLRAPFSGIIARRDVENFTNVQAGQSIGLLQRLAVVDLSFDVPGTDITALAEAGFDGVSTQVVFDALPDATFDAELVEFSTQADAATLTYRGRVAVEVPVGSVVLPGMVGNVVTSAPTSQTAVSIPMTALGAGADGSPILWVVGDDETVSSRPVTLGDASGDHVTVLDGIEPGEVVVSAGVGQLTEGLAIRPISRIGG